MRKGKENLVKNYWMQRLEMGETMNKIEARTCALFYCDRRRQSVCCADCGFRDRNCKNHCMNDPNKCGQCKRPEMEVKRGIIQ